MSSILLDTFRLHGCAFSERHVFLASLPLQLSYAIRCLLPFIRYVATFPSCASGRVFQGWYSPQSVCDGLGLGTPHARTGHLGVHERSRNGAGRHGVGRSRTIVRDVLGKPTSTSERRIELEAKSASLFTGSLS